jgi:predicted secreted hydrolase
MRRNISIAIITLIILIAIALIWVAVQPPDSPNLEASIINAQDFELPAIGFARVDDSYEWEFPRDVGPHPQFQREAWQLETSSDSCSFQLNMLFNRTSILPPNLNFDRSSDWAISSILNATLTLSNNDQTLIETDRSSRIALDLAGADDNHVWLENWSLDWQNGHFTLTDNNIEIRLTLTLDSPDSPSTSDQTYAYQQSGRASGPFTLDNDTRTLDCPITLTHRFGA